MTDVAEVMNGRDELFYFQQCTINAYESRGAVAAPFPCVSQSLLVKVRITSASTLLFLLPDSYIVHIH